MRFGAFWTMASLATVFVLFSSSASYCQWQRAGLNSLTVMEIVFRAGDSDTAYAVGGGMVYRSIDCGDTWLPVGLIGSVRGLAVDPISKDYVYAVCDQAIYRSADAGTTWIRSDSGFKFSSEYGPTDIAVSPCHPDTIYVTTADWVGGGGLYRSANRGDTWSVQDTPWPENKTCVVVDFGDCGKMFVGVSCEGPLGLSVNSGLSWAASGLAAVVRSLAINPQDGSRIFAADYTGTLYRSRDGGITWSVLDEAVGLGTLAVCVAVNPVCPQIVLVAGPGGVYRSVDDGDSWAPYNDGLPEGTYVYSVAFEAEFGETAILGTYQDGIFRDDCLAGVDTPKKRPAFRLSLRLAPNPARNMVMISYDLPQSDYTTLGVYDVMGQAVADIVSGYGTAGCHSALWNGRNSSGDRVPSGIYFLRLLSGCGNEVKPVVISR